jgi:hypothetical protein
VHPSFLLRLPDKAAKAQENDQFVVELAEARALAGQTAGDGPGSRS